MDNFLFTNVVITFAETRIKGKIDYDELTYMTGFSLSYIRELFANQMNKPLYRYILERKRAIHGLFRPTLKNRPIEDTRAAKERLVNINETYIFS